MSRYAFNSMGDILDKSCGTTGHTMFTVDIVRDLNLHHNRITELEAENKRYREALEERDKLIWLLADNCECEVAPEVSYRLEQVRQCKALAKHDKAKGASE